MTTPTIDILNGKRVLRVSETCVQGKGVVGARIQTLAHSIDVSLPEAIAAIDGNKIAAIKSASLGHQIDRLARARAALDGAAEGRAAQDRMKRRLDQAKATLTELESIVEDLDE